jgi:putative inorganic carbon (hco3(-)) transporter
MHFGVEPYIPYVEYLGFIAGFFLTVFWRPIVGIFYLLPLIPLQTIRYRANGFPLGESIMGLMLLGVVLGLLWRGQPVLPQTPLTKLLCTYAMFTFVSLCLGSLYLGQSLPFPSTPRLGVWKDYMVMPALLLLTAAVAPTRRQMKAMIIVMCLTIFVVDHNLWSVISGRDLSAYSNDLRVASSMGYAGSNGLAAFGAQATTLLLALAAFKPKILLRIAYWALAAFSAFSVMYSFSRGGYLALLAGCLFLGLVKQRTLLVLLLVFVSSWATLVPNAVRQRVLMTYDSQSGSFDHSAETRLSLWDDAIEVFRTSPVMGTGFDTYAYMHRIGEYDDTHNIFLKFLVETGVLGLFIFLWLLCRIFVTGYLLFRRAEDPFLASLGLGLAAWVVCCFVANCFGDRWTFLQVNGYMWVLGGLVSRAWVLQPSGTSAPVEAGDAEDDSGAMLEAATRQA